MMAVDFAPGSPPRIGRPHTLFEFEPGDLGFMCSPLRCYDVAPDGQRFYAVRHGTPAAPASGYAHQPHPELVRGAEGEGAGGRREVGRLSASLPGLREGGAVRGSAPFVLQQYPARRIVDVRTQGAAVPSETLTGRTVGHYLILGVLGEGGMGVVYQARDTRLGRLAALKMMRPDWAGEPDQRRRFVREARTASSLNHPNILTIYEIDADGGQDYIAMEYVEGGTLADVMKAGPLEAERALRVAAQVADALEAAHAASIVHRDLKPSNIMMTAADRVKVVDFGLAKLSAASPADETADALTEQGAVVGTTSYMSPEQAAGHAVDGRSDLFSLGIILYEMLAGRRPFAADSTAGTLAAILRDAPAPIPGLAPGLSRLLGRCLHKEVTGRFQSAGELKDAILGCLAPHASPAQASVAVLPFTRMTGAAEDDYLCEGLAEEIINALTRIPGLKVIARTSAFAVSRMGLDVREAGARLDVGHILEGSVRRDGARVRVTAQLVSTSDGSHLWSERYDREMTDVLALEDEIAAAIAARLRVEFAGANRDRPHPVVDPEAHAAYLEGRYYFARGTPDALAHASACFERAIARDPTSALAYDSLAELYWYLGFFGNVRPRDAFSQSTWYALRALELDDTLAQTHALLGMLRKELDYNWPEVDRELQRALDLNRESPLVRLRYAISGLLPHARNDEAMRRARGTPPGRPAVDHHPMVDGRAGAPRPEARSHDRGGAAHDRARARRISWVTGRLASG